MSTDDLTPKKYLEDDASTLANEWRNLPIDTSFRKKEKLFSAALKYSDKNRYTDVLPFDSTRVCLVPTEKNEDGYINASYVTLPRSRAISTQGPLPQCFEDFWQMVWENKVRIIVMLTKLRERQRVKAHCYWPTEEEDYEVFGEVKVQSISTKAEEHYVIRKFIISCKDKQRTIYQIQYTDWPDFGVPASSQSILDLLETIEKHRAKFKVNSSKRTQLLFHCSAGIGRCGTLLSIYYAIEQIKEGVSVSEISVPDIVCSLRKNRSGMVQTQEQYAFIYKGVNDFLHGGSNTKPRKRDLRQISAPSAASIRRKNRGLRSNRTVQPPKPKKSQTWQNLPVDCTIIDVN